MTESEQIEEMAKMLCGMENSCNNCIFRSENCYERNDAEAIYSKGYRKVARGEWKLNKKELGVDRAEAECSICGREVVYQVIDGIWGFENFCPHCGADMRGDDNEG